MEWSAPLSSNDRLFAALGHASIVLPGLGFLLPVVLWSVRREAQASLRFQLLQAASFQAAYPLISLLAWMLAALLGLLLTLVTGLVLRAQGAGVETSIGLLGVLRIAGLALWLLLWLAFMITGLVGVVACLSGHSFRYPRLGNWMLEFLEGHTDGEARWMAVLCHLGIFRGFLGLISTLLVWVTRREDSPFLKFHALQAFIYQLIQQGFGFLVSFILIPLAILPVLFLPTLSREGIQSPAGLLGLGGSLLILGCAGLFALVIPLYQTLPLVAAFRLLQGRSYTYPLLGRYIHLQATPNQAAASEGSA